MIDKNVLDPEVTAAARCHGCNEIVLLGTRQCQYCGIELDQAEMKARALKSVKIDQAIASANTIRTFTPGMFLFLLLALARLLLDFSVRQSLLSTVLCFSPVIIIGLWFIKHGGWKSSEEDYLSSKHAMKSAFLGWLAVNILNGVTLYISNR